MREKTKSCHYQIKHEVVEIREIYTYANKTTNIYTYLLFNIFFLKKSSKTNVLLWINSKTVAEGQNV